MSLLIIQPNLTSKEAHDWLVDVFIQMARAMAPDEEIIDDFARCIEVLLSYEDTDAIFEKAMKGLLE